MKYGGDLFKTVLSNALKQEWISDNIDRPVYMLLIPHIQCETDWLHYFWRKVPEINLFSVLSDFMSILQCCLPLRIVNYLYLFQDVRQAPNSFATQLQLLDAARLKIQKTPSIRLWFTQVWHEMDFICSGTCLRTQWQKSLLKKGLIGLASGWHHSSTVLFLYSLLVFQNNVSLLLVEERLYKPEGRGFVSR